MFFLAQIEVPQGPAWVVGMCSIVAALTYMSKTVLELRWSVGSKARIEEMKADAELKKAAAEADLAQAKLDQTNAEDITSALSASYEEKLAEVKIDCEKKLASMQAHVDIIDKKLDAAETRERRCVEELAKLQGRLGVLEELANVRRKLDSVEDEVKANRQKG